jgi:hypothetical protein
MCIAPYRAGLPFSGFVVHTPFSVLPPSRRLLVVLGVTVVLYGWAATPMSVSDRMPPAERIFYAKSASYTRKLPPLPSLGERAARIAIKAVGVPYRWGGASVAGGFDCSGLIHWAYGHLGIELPHSSYALYELGRQVTPERMKPGDVLFFSGLGHVGLYLGRGRMVHAPQSGRNVEIVTLGGSYYGERLVGARRMATT